MIRHDVEQGSAAWLALRLGMPTASGFDQLITLKKMEPSASARGYRGRLLAEWLVGEPVDDDTSAFMERGTGLEDEALRWYAFERNVEIERVGFLTDDTGSYGCSPDALVVGEPRGVEVKCLGAAHHVAYLCATPDELVRTEFHAQVQGSMLVTGYPAWDLVLYHPRMPSLILSVPRDDIFLAKLGPILARFVAELREAKETLIRRGYHPPEDGVSGWLKLALERSLAGQV